MKAKYQTANGRLTFEFEGANHKDIVTELATIQEIFEEPSCGCCKSERIRFDVREFDGNKYYKLFCEACGATLDFGQHKTGDTLFAKRFVKDTREPMPNRGWYIYLGGDDGRQHTPPPEPQAPRQQTPPPPAKPADRPANASPTTTTQKQGPNVSNQRQSVDEIHRLVLQEFREAKTPERVETIKARASKHNFSQHQREEQADAFYAAMDQVAPLQTATSDNGIPF